MGSNSGWDAEGMFQKYLHDYLVKKNMHTTAEIFAKEANADVRPVAIDSPEGFLAEWWSIFYDVYFSMQSRCEESFKRASNKGKQVIRPTTQSSCSETSKLCQNQQIPGLFPVGNDTGSMFLQSASKTNSQFNNGDQNQTKPAGITQSKPQRQPRQQAQKRQDKKRAVNLGSKAMGSSGHGGPTTIGSEKLSSTATLLKGWSLNGTNETSPHLVHQAPNSHFPAAKNQQQLCSQHELFAQLMAAAAAAALSPVSLSSDLEMLLRTGLDETNSQGYQDEEERPIDDNIEKFLLNYDEHGGRNNSFGISLPDSRSFDKEEHAGISLSEVGSLHASQGKIFSCNFSPDGKFLASAGQDKKVFLWNMDTLGYISSLESHSQLVTDVQFHPTSELFATSSFDKTVRVWDTARPKRSLFTLVGHTDHVMSLDFHPRKMDLLCSCDTNDEIRLWNVEKKKCLHVSKGAIKQVRFQPQMGRILATAAGNGVNIFDVETSDFIFDLKGHHSEVRSISWDSTGKYIASVSEETVRLWSVLNGGQCIYELNSKGNNFQSCTFHPGYPFLLIIGSYQSLCLWNSSQSNTINHIQAHDGQIASLASSPFTNLIASGSHDQCVKLWK